MKNRYFVKTLVMSSGERLPVLMDSVAGRPMFAPTIYSLTQLRGRNLASSTMEQALRHIMILQLFLDQFHINLNARFHEGRVFDLSEIEELVNTCRLPAVDVAKAKDVCVDEAKVLRVTSIEKFRQKQNFVIPKRIDGKSSSNRIRGITDYLSWLTKSELMRLPAGGSKFNILESACKLVTDGLTARISNSRSRNTVGNREGLGPEISQRLLAVIDRNSDENPWQGDFVRARNELAVRWLYAFGLRRGELLSVKVSDIDFRKEQVTIARRADDKYDPRPDQPLAKTRDRILPIPSDLSQLTHDYVINTRKKLLNARKHEFLFVADKTGAPLSLSALNKCFVFLRSRVKGLSSDLSPHVLRHTWNENFSVAMDTRKISSADEQKMRSFLMGWSETSGTAETYTRRHVRQKANEVSLQMQNDMTRGVEIK